MKLYIVGPENGGEGVYYIVTELGECLASHLCSNSCFALGDLEGDRPERKEEWNKRFGTYVVLFIGEDEMTRNKLIELNHKLESEKNDKNI